MIHTANMNEGSQQTQESIAELACNIEVNSKVRFQIVGSTEIHQGSIAYVSSTNSKINIGIKTRHETLQTNINNLQLLERN